MANGRLSQMEYGSFLQVLNVDRLDQGEVEEIIEQWCCKYLVMEQSMKDRFWLLLDEVMDVDEVFEVLHSGTFWNTSRDTEGCL